MKSPVWFAILVSILLPKAARAFYGPSFFPEDFGAVANDGVDDRAAIQAALNAAGAVGGAVRLGPGEYHVRVIAANGLGGTSGYHGVTVAPGSALMGEGMDLTKVIFLGSTGHPDAIGDGIVNGGYQTALTDFGAGGGILIANLRVETPDTHLSHTGNLIGLAHADGVTISNVAFGASRLVLALTRREAVAELRLEAIGLLL